MNWVETGRFLVVAGVVVLAVGLVLMMGDRLPIGRLPGDFQFGGGRFKVYVPLATCILISVLITLVVNFFSRK